MRSSLGRCYDERSAHARSALVAVVCALVYLDPPAAAAQADSAPTTVVLIDRERSAISRRLQQELEALGFHVEVRARAVNSALSEQLREPRTIAAIEIHPARSGQVDIVVVDPRNTDLVRRSLAIEAQADPTSAELVATRTVELLRAARLRVEVPHEAPPNAHEPQAPPQTPPAASTAAPARSPSKTALSLGAALGASPPFRVGTHGWLALSVRFDERWSALTELALPLSPATLQRAEGEVDALTNALRAGAWLESSRAGRVGLGVGAGAELALVSFRGRAADPYLSQESRLVTYGPWLRAGALVRLSSTLRALTTLTASVSLPTSTVRLANREAAHYGSPNLYGALGVEWTP